MSKIENKTPKSTGQAGKGSRPRNIYSKGFKLNYAGIKWDKPSEYTPKVIKSDGIRTTYKY